MTMEISKDLVVNIIINHMNYNSSYKNRVGKFLNQDINSDEHLHELLSFLNEKELEYLLLKI